MLCSAGAVAAENGVTVRGLAAASESPVVATDMRIGGDDKQTRFVVDLSRKIDLAAFTLADPYRVVVDLPQTTFTLHAKVGEQARGLVKAFRYGLIMQGGSRIVLDTKGPVRLEKAFVLDATDSQRDWCLISSQQTAPVSCAISCWKIAPTTPPPSKRMKRPRKVTMMPDR